MRHNKKRNTAFIYEILTREFTKSIVFKNNNRKRTVVSILKDYFAKGNPLAEELELYGVLLNTNNTEQKIAERYLQETKVAHDHLDENAIFDQQSKIISAINKNLGKEVWANFVPNFKSLASVSAIFNSDISVKKRVLFEQAVVDQMSRIAAASEEEGLRPIDNLTYVAFIKKFNNKYTDLLSEQKDLLNHYITSFADNEFELKVYLNEELARLKGILSAAAEKEPEQLISQRAVAVIEYLEEFRKREFKENDLNKVLKTQELVRELATNDHD
tara:strand:+ start:2262 stop:3080 length:819 start_codon:yes stop_codon:yes gene_type:complete